MHAPDITAPPRQSYALDPSGKYKRAQVTITNGPSMRPTRPRQRKTRLTRERAELRPEPRRGRKELRGEQSILRVPSPRSSGIEWASKDVVRRYRELGYLWQPAETPANT